MQKSVEEIASKISSLSLSNNNLQIEIENTAESISNSTQNRIVPLSPPNAAMGIIDELADRDRRKKNLIIYNLPEPTSKNQSDSDLFTALCSSVFNRTVTITRSIRLGKKEPNKHRILLLCLEHEEDKLTLLSHSYLLRQNDLHKNALMAPDRTKFEREKHRKLVEELRERHSQGESGLIIRNGVNITKPAARYAPTIHNSVPSSPNHPS